jgi:hypothetical protein
MQILQSAFSFQEDRTQRSAEQARQPGFQIVMELLNLMNNLHRPIVVVGIADEDVVFVAGY